MSKIAVLVEQKTSRNMKPWLNDQMFGSTIVLDEPYILRYEQSFAGLVAVSNTMSDQNVWSLSQSLKPNRTDVFIFHNNAKINK